MFPFSPASESRTRRMRAPSESSGLYSSRSRSREYYRKDSRDSPPHADRSSNKIAECTFIGGIRVIEIWSEYLVKAIEKVIQYPQLQPIEGFFTEQEPYPTLFYHMKDVETEIAQMDNQVANDHLKTLKIATNYIVPTWDEAREEKFTDKLVSYGMIWKYFRPGDLVLGEDDLGNLWLLGLIKISRSILRDRRPDKEEGKREERISFDTWVLAWNEADDDLERKYATFTCSEFSGKRHITSLPIYPIRYLEEKTRENIEANLAKRGRKWKKLITAASICQYHCGLAFIPEGGRAVGEKFQADGRIVIDVHSKNPPLISDIFESAKRPLEHQVPYTRRHVNEEPWRERISVSATLTDDQAMLCPAMIRCHDLRSKKRYFVSVDNLQPIEWNKDAMDHLVLDTRKKDMLKGLVSYHSSRNRGNEKADIIAGKGQSLVILLHGPPGVGKTLTAESTAEAVGKPLIAMSIGEMVWEETQLQERLRTEFQRAVDWDAVLLLDEADVVLEARSFEDVRRNGIVSIFLRELEYYRGILFLTTNRVSTMDTAFQSRIQIGIAFQSMTPKIRADVWTQLLTLNGRDKILGSEAVKNIQTRLSKYELNGRQIRNALNVAEGLAFQEYGEEGKLRYRHIEEATKAAAEFQKMLEESKSMMKLEQTVWAPYKGGDGDSIY